MTDEIDLLALLHGNLRATGADDTEAEDEQSPVYGATLAEVTDLDDPLFLGRIKVKFPWLSSQVESAWARIAVPWAGSMRGSYFPPTVGDEALAIFRHGDLKHPYILGFLWSDTVRPPELTPRLQNYEIKADSGAQLLFDEFTGLRKVLLKSS